MKKAIIIFLTMAVLVGGGLYFFIQNAKKNAKTAPATPTTKTTKSGNNPSATEKSGTTTKTGKITSNGGVFSLQEAGQTPKEIDSYAVDLSKYVGKTVTVTGQYSGDTLFVGSVK